MPRYTVKDPATGRTVTFDWYEDTPFTDEDLDEIFAEAAQSQPPPKGRGGSIEAGSGTTWVDTPANYPFKGGTGIVAVDAVKSLFDKQGLPGTLGTMTAAGMAASGVGLPLAVPASAAVAGLTRKVLGGTDQEAMQEAAWDAGGNLLGLGIPKVAGAIGRYGVRSALKKGSATPNEIDDIVQTSIYEGITPGRSGFNKADERIKTLHSDVMKLLDSVTGEVDVSRAARNIQAVRQRAIARGAEPSEIAAIDAIAEQFASTGRIDRLAAQELKSGLMERAAANRAYQRFAPPGTTAGKGDAQAAVAGGVREQLETLAPGVAEPNARQSDLIRLRDAMVTNEPPMHPAAGVATMFGGPKVAAIQIGARPQVQAAVGRRLARVAQAFDPDYMGVPAPQYPEPPRPVRGLLRPAPHLTEPPPDPSFARGVRGEYARHDVRGLLPENATPEARFYAGQAGVADTQQVYRDQTPLRGSGTILDAEFAEAPPLPARVAAEYGTGPAPARTVSSAGMQEVGAGNPAYSTFEALVPNRFKEARHLSTGLTVQEQQVQEALLAQNPHLSQLTVQEWKRVISDALEGQGTLRSGGQAPRALKSNIDALYQRYKAGR
jgi:hypothetical protein